MATPKNELGLLWPGIVKNLARVAHADDRTVNAYFDGKPIRALCKQRIEAAIATVVADREQLCGLLDEPNLAEVVGKPSLPWPHLSLASAPKVRA